MLLFFNYLCISWGATLQSLLKAGLVSNIQATAVSFPNRRLIQYTAIAISFPHKDDLTLSIPRSKSKFGTLFFFKTFLKTPILISFYFQSSFFPEMVNYVLNEVSLNPASVELFIV